jgi:hypothetical protein
MHQSGMASCIWISVGFVNASTNFIHAAQNKNHMLHHLAAGISFIILCIYL